MSKNKRIPWTAGEHIAAGLAKSIEVGECLEWQGAMVCSGSTPAVRVRTGKKHGENVTVCRVLWEVAYGPVPAGMMVYRTCCNNACVHLDHLTIGTHKERLANRKKHGLTKHSTATRMRMALSARQRADLVNTMDKAREVRALVGQMQQKDIAAVTGVSPAMVSEICNGNAWREFVGNPFAGLGG